MSSIMQGVLVVEAYANDERAVARTIQENMSKAITQLNSEGKRIIKISNGPSVQYVLGVNHISYILWEYNNAKENTSLQQGTYSSAVISESHNDTHESKTVERQFNTLMITADNVSNLLDTVSKSISEGDFEKAENYCSQILDYYPHNARANILRLLIECKATSIEKLFTLRTAAAIADSPYFIEAKENGDSSSFPEFNQIVSKLEEHEKYREKMGINADSLLETASKLISEGEFEKAENYCSQVLDCFPNHARANILRLLIESKATSVEKLFTLISAPTIEESPYFIAAKKDSHLNYGPEFDEINSKLEEFEKYRDKTVDVVIRSVKNIGDDYSKLCYELHYLTGLRLFECKKLIENLPYKVTIPAFNAAETKTKLESAGATVIVQG